MTRLLVLGLAIASGLLSLAPAAARADDCVALGGAIVGSECQISTAVSRSGTFNLDETLRVLSTGKISVPAAAGGNSLTIDICTSAGSCDLVMDSGGQISGNVTGTGNSTGVGATISINASNDIVLHGTGAAGASITSNQSAGSCTGGRGGNINLTAASDITIDAGAVVSANAKCPAGTITLIATQGTIVQNGSVLSESTLSGTGGGRPGGGPITIIARCDLSVGGTVSSKGADPGADLVHLEGGCNVTISGLVQSTGPGHDIPFNPANHCYGPDVNNPSRPDKPANSTACIEVWAGDLLTITGAAEINADTGSTGGNDGTSWIDLFARGNITISGDLNDPFAVHANGKGGSGGAGENGGIVTVKSRDAAVTATGKALQAKATSASNADGGSIIVEAALNVTLDTATLDASAGGTGGSIAARSFKGALSWQNGVGNVQDNATGTITLTTCLGLIPTTGSNFNGETPSKVTGSCAVAAPSFQSYVHLPNCICAGPFPPDGDCPQDPNRLITRSVDPTGGQHGLIPNSLTLQEAVDSASSGEIIGVFGNTDENVVISNKRLTITQCTLARITALDGSLPVVSVSTLDPLLVIGLDSLGGSIGWLVQSSGHEFRGLRATGASDACIAIEGNSNRVSWNNVSQCGVGIRVTGDSNDLRGGTVELNTGDGVQIGDTGSGNVLQGATVRQNGGNGIAVAGSGNTIKSNARVDQNTLNGVLVTGNGNSIKSNTAGSGDGAGNIQDGFKVTGLGNTLDSNKATDNHGNGFNVAGGIVGAANVLKSNLSNLGTANGSRENTGAEYLLADTVKSSGGNKADGVAVPKLTAPAKCTQFPLVGQVKTFPAPYVCE
jgi:hypothetical protein